MRGLVVTSAVVGVLAAGVVPGLLLTGGQQSTTASSAAPTRDARPVAAAAAAAEDDVREGQPAWAPGPPPWARGWACGPHGKAHADSKTEKKPDASERDAGKGRPWRCDGSSANGKAVPPGWADGPDGHPGNGHGARMRAWAHCVAARAKSARARDGESFDPEAACGAKPKPPGRTREQARAERDED